MRLIWLGAVLLCCTSPKSDNHRQAASTNGYLKYARGFSVQQTAEGITEVIVTKPYPGATQPLVYVLVPDSSNYSDKSGATVIRVPVKKLVCTSTTHIPLLDYLNKTDALAGFPGLQYISSPAMRQRIDRGEVTELGLDKSMNIERLLMLQPDLVMAYLVSGDFGQVKKIQELGIPVVINAEYLEPHPLGRAEWIKFMALFFNMQQKADSIFRFIENEYLSTREKALHAATHPTVLSGIMYSDTWFAPGGRNYGARLLTDAGCRYIWQHNESDEYLELSYEAVLAKGQQADLWIGVGGFTSLKEMEEADDRYTRFSAFRNRQVYTYNGRIGPTGGSEYLELGYLRPDIILKDLVKIAHPELLPDHALYFHARLK
ncbi:MAG: hypothetical protein KatS3mg032_1045 [Cyclobacteriaceae bacterium]|nr:MAG: hypothetical protein KatS3mg032_1045 [Cyclobacteriaceae bacterium]